MIHRCLAHRRHLVLTALAAVAVFAAPWAMAQTFPSKPLRIVVPFAAGGAGDLTARIVGAELSQFCGVLGETLRTGQIP